MALHLDYGPESQSIAPHIHNSIYRTPDPTTFNLFKEYVYKSIFYRVTFFRA